MSHHKKMKIKMVGKERLNVHMKTKFKSLQHIVNTFRFSYDFGSSSKVHV